MARPQDFTILVVDDEPDVVIYLKTLLEDTGFHVMTAADGDEALELVKRRKPDFISLDLVMPRKSGIRFFYELRHNREWSRIPVVIVTAHARDERIQKDIRDLFEERTMTGPRTYLEKPIKPGNYINLVKQELGLSTDSETDTASQEIDRLKAKARELLDRTDPETLKKALELLAKNNPKS